MGRKCAVPHCYTGYRKCKEKASLYRVPDDDFFLTKWQEAIARDDRPITPKDYVCEKHFKDDDILRRRIIKDVVEEYQRPRLKPDAIPSIFPDLPEFILKMVKKRRKMPSEDTSKETDEVTTTSSGDDKTDVQSANENEVEVKLEPTEASGDANLSIERNENILNNEVDIKSDPEENTIQPVNDDVDSEKSDPSFGPKMHQCDQCSYQTKYAHNLRTHKTKHLTGEEAYLRCNYCPNYKTKWELTFRNHLKIKHGIGKQEIFKCTLCQYQTKVKLCLKRHYERHACLRIFEKELSCVDSGCGFKTKSKSLLDMHLQSHGYGSLTEEKSFKCTECFYETNSKSHIIKHIKSAHNTGDDTVVTIKASNAATPPNETLKCLKCPYRSENQDNFLRHVFKHRYLKPCKELKTWKCPKCPYVTFFQHAFETHAQSECGKEIYVCFECNFRSQFKTDHVRHMLSHRNVTDDSINLQNMCVEPDVQHIGTGNDNEEQGDNSFGGNFKTIKEIKQEYEEFNPKTVEEVVLIKEEIHSDDLE